MKTLVLATTAALALAAPVHSQTWTAGAFDTGGLIYGSVAAPENSLTLACNTPSPQGRALFETGDHETNLSEPFEMFLEVSYQLIASAGAADILPEATLVVDGAGFRLPPILWDEFIGTWQVAIRMDDPLFDALRDARDLVFDAGQGTAWQYPVDGLSAGLGIAMQACVDGWGAAGQQIPSSLSRFWREGTEDGQSISQALAALPGSATVVPVSPIPTPDQVPTAIDIAAAEGCNGVSHTIDPASVQTADLDGDGLNDYVFNHNGVRCGGRMSGYCGAANCSIDVFLSSQSYAHRPEFLGMSAGFLTMNDGRTGIQISGTYSMCGETGLCPGPLVWTGTEFDLLEVDRVGPELIPPQTPEFLQSHFLEICNNNFGVQLESIGQIDFDGDGVLDFIFDGAGLRCSRPSSRPYCGAALCTISVYLSSLGYQEGGGFIGTGYTIGFSESGQAGFRRGDTNSGPLEIWDGANFVVIEK